MADSDLDLLQTALKRRWSRGPSQKAKPYVHAFSAAERRGTKITAKVVGNHGTYTVSIQGDTQGVTSACSCYIGKHGHCHHCEALTITFLDDPSAFKIIVTAQLGCPASQSESAQPWRGGCRLTLIMSPAHVKDDETPREAMQGFATFFMRDKERWQHQSLGSRTPAAVYFNVYPDPSRGIFVSNGLDHGGPLRRPLGEEHHGWTSLLHRSQAGWS